MMMKSKWFWWSLVIAWCAVIYCFSEFSVFTGENTEKVIRHVIKYWAFAGAEGNDASSPLNFVIRKFAHLSAFGILAFLVWKAMFPHRFAWIGAWSFAVLYAATDEWHQSFQPGRTALVSDVLIDACGALLALLFVRMYLRLKHF
jgi:VanZ family protein